MSTSGGIGPNSGQIDATGAATAEEALSHLLDTQEEQDRWLMDDRDAINAKIRRGIAQLDRGEGVPEDELNAYLAKQKIQGADKRD